MRDVLVGAGIGVAVLAVVVIVGLLVAAGRVSRAERAAAERDHIAEVDAWLDAVRPITDPVMCTSPGCPWSATAFCSDAACPGPRDDVERVVVEDRGPVDGAAWLDELLADVGVTPDMTSEQASARIDAAITEQVRARSTPDLDVLLEQIDRALRAVADAGGVEHAGRSVRLLCDPAAGPCSLHGDGAGCRAGSVCCPTCPRD